MKYKLKKNKNHRKLFRREEYFIYKSILKNGRISGKLRLIISFKFQEFLKKSTLNKSYKNCISSNDSRSVNKIFNLNDRVLKAKFEKGELNGFKKSSW